ncbi:TetR/AcrR family transcriptional regulator [Magnetovibrio sp.]|uniref:TetR/AcrR family transcriptional regulator n=1 Tax=Magnetovibrio sp. TaxID=2024836 RepID=UPI002F93018E
MRSGEATREKIKRAALELFVDKGVDGGGMRDIAKASAITEGAIYRHFSSKDELVWTLFRDNFTNFAATLSVLQAGEVSTAAKIEAMVQGFCQLFDRDETLFRFLLLVQHGQLSKITDDMANPIDVVQNVIQTGIDAGEVGHADATEATAWVFGIVLQTATFQIYGRLPGPLSPRADALAGACLDALGL